MQDIRGRENRDVEARMATEYLRRGSTSSFQLITCHLIARLISWKMHGDDRINQFMRIHP